MKFMTLLRQAKLVAVTALSLGGPAFAPSAAARDTAKPTVVLVHGAFAGNSSWSGVVPGLERAGYKVVAVANPLRSLKSDAAYVSDLVKSLQGPVILVGHSYGGSVITNAAVGNDNVKALVYVSALAPDTGESAFDLVGKFPGSILGAGLKAPVTLSSGAHDLYVQPEKFRSALAADLPATKADQFAAIQRPVTDTALKDASGAPAWKDLPSWFVYGSADKSVPPAAFKFMADRAGAKKAIVIAGASHLVMVSHPEAVEHFIEETVAASAK